MEAPAGGRVEVGTVKTPTICQVFTRDLEGLMRELNASHVHFVRCIKPNDALTPGAPDAGLVLDQLRFSGMLEAVALISSGYPGRLLVYRLHSESTVQNIQLIYSFELGSTPPFEPPWTVYAVRYVLCVLQDSYRTHTPLVCVSVSYPTVSTEYCVNEATVPSACVDRSVCLCPG